MGKDKTDIERVKHVQVDLYQLERMISEKGLELDDLADFIPGFIHLNSMQDITLTYISPNMAEYFEKDIDQINKEGSAFQYHVVHPNSAKIVVPQLQQFVQNDDPYQVLGYFQYMRPNDEADYQWYITLSKIRKEDGVIFSINNPLSSFGVLESQLTFLLDENFFMKKNYCRFEQLTRREKEILKWIARGETNQMISDRLYISKFTVKTHRRNIASKLETSKIADFIKYAQVFGL